MRNRLRELRSGQGFSRAQLGTALGISRQTVNAIENERYTARPGAVESPGRDLPGLTEEIPVGDSLGRPASEWPGRVCRPGR
ncbi:helix-turn-helix transcriptional regulator [Streptomyces sp. NPDC092903]|uniref:helix-turn-helix transcriptional regulator n=1 Tax=Streptomyces sp. NPDC092903 TaxID=3366017 RepID=UPI0037F46888